MPWFQSLPIADSNISSLRHSEPPSAIQMPKFILKSIYRKYCSAGLEKTSRLESNSLMSLYSSKDSAMSGPFAIMLKAV